MSFTSGDDREAAMRAGVERGIDRDRRFVWPGCEARAKPANLSAGLGTLSHCAIEMQPLALRLTPRFSCTSYTCDSRPCATSGRMIGSHHQPSTAREAAPEDCTARGGFTRGQFILGAEPDDIQKPVNHEMTNFSQRQQNICCPEKLPAKPYVSALPKFWLFYVLLSRPRFRKEQWPMNNSMSERTTTLLVWGRERGKIAARIEGGAQSRVTGGNSPATR